MRDFVSWWARQMGGLLQQHLLPSTEHADALLVTAEPPELILTLRHRGRETLIGRFGMSNEGLADAVTALRRKPRRVILRLGPGLLLERPVELPLAAERELDRVIGFEMDRLTPFTAAEAVWHAEVTARDHVQRSLRLRLTLVPQRALRPLLDLLTGAGLAPAWLEAASPDGTPRRIMLTTDTTRRSGGKTATAVSVVGVLLVAATVTPFVVQSLARGATESAIEVLAPRVARVQALRKDLAAGAAGADALQAERLRVGNVLQVLAAVTDIVPDDTWLSELSLHQGKLTLSGQSPAAARMISALASDPSFRNPTFAAPVTRAPDGHADLFVIRTELAQ